MTKRRIAAALLVASAGSALLNTAALAHADPTSAPGSSQNDQAFLQFITENGLTAKSDAFAIDLAHSTCDVLQRTGSVQDALQHVKDATKWKSITKVSNFGAVAVQAYCQDAMPAQ